MKKVTMLFTRHGKNTAELERTLPEAEIDRAQVAGEKLYDHRESIDAVYYSPLPRAIQTAFAIIMGHNSGSPCLMPAVPAFGTDQKFGELTAPSQFRTLAAVKGNYLALFDVHELSALQPWFDGLTAAVGQIFVGSVDGDTVLMVIHSPSIEAALDNILKRQGSKLAEEYMVLSELDTLVVEASQESDEAPMTIEVLWKIPAPTIEEAQNS